MNKASALKAKHLVNSNGANQQKAQKWLPGPLKPVSRDFSPAGLGFPTQGLNPGLLHFRQILYQLSYEGSLVVHL